MPSIASSNLQQTIATVMNHRDSKDATLVDIARALQHIGTDVVPKSLKHNIQLIFQPPQMGTKLDEILVMRYFLIAVHNLTQLVLGHERIIAFLFFVASIISGFPILFFISIPIVIFFGIIAHVVSLIVLACVGHRPSEAEANRLSSDFQSTLYGAAAHDLPRHRTGLSGLPYVRYTVRNPGVLLLSWVCMITSIALFVDSFYRETA